MAGLSSAVSWFVNNVGKATWWRAKACQKYPSNCHFEGGVDIPLPAKTPIYALATGTLMGAGNFNMALGGFGHGVVTQNVPGVGQVYYQHIDIDSSIPHCKNGNCGAYVVQAGQLLGYSTAAIGEVEVGINPTWGGYWGTNSDPSIWVADPRQELIALAQGSVNTAASPPPTTNCAALPTYIERVKCYSAQNPQYGPPSPCTALQEPQRSQCLAYCAQASVVDASAGLQKCYSDCNNQSAVSVSDCKAVCDSSWNFSQTNNAQGQCEGCAAAAFKAGSTPQQMCQEFTGVGNATPAFPSSGEVLSGIWNWIQANTIRLLKGIMGVIGLIIAIVEVFRQ